MAEAENWLRLSKEKLQGEAEAKSVPARDRCLRARHPAPNFGLFVRPSCTGKPLASTSA
jgi:hypothetical protein